MIHLNLTFIKRNYKTGELGAKWIDVVPFQDVIIDIMTDESFKVTLSGVTTPSKGDLCEVRLKAAAYALPLTNISELFVVDKVISNTEVQLKYFYEAFNQIEVVDIKSMNIYDMLTAEFKENTDKFMNMNFMDISLGFKGLSPTFKTTSTDKAISNIQNVKEIFLNTLIKYRRSFKAVLNMASDNQTRVGLYLGDVTGIYNDVDGVKVGADSGFFLKPIEFPELIRKNNIASFFVTVTKEYTTVGSTETSVRVLYQGIDTWYLLDDNTVTKSQTDSRRILPPQKVSKELVYNYKKDDVYKPIDTKPLAEQELVDTSNYEFTVELANITGTTFINQEPFMLGKKWVFVTKDSKEYTTILTRVHYKKESIELTFGTTRNSLMFLIKKGIK